MPAKVADKYRGHFIPAALELVEIVVPKPQRKLVFFRHTGAQPESVEAGAFQLHNNLYGTNFPMWIEDDANVSLLKRYSYVKT